MRALTGRGFPSAATALKLSVALFASGDEKSGIGSPSVLFTTHASLPNPRSANACHIRSRFAPPKRAWSAASIASLARRIVALRGMGTIES